MVANEGFGDRAIRLMLGSCLVTLAATGHGAWGWFGLLQIATGLSGYCVLYVPLGIDTTKWCVGRRHSCAGVPMGPIGPGVGAG
jgi:Inner membrane protein YgaP-like, transmembrane domain